MLASWVRETTATTGTGTITLSGTADAGFQTFDNAFSTGDVVHYTIEDGNNREVGIGTLTSGASWTLSRDFIHETLSGGTYTRLPATGISLSGSAVVGTSPSASSQQIPYGESQAALGTGLIPDNWYGGSSSETRTLQTNRLYLVPSIFHRPVEVTKRTINVTTAGSGGSVTRVGLYKAADDGTPNALLADGSVDVTTTGTKTYTLGASVKLMPGQYLLAVATDHSSCVVRGIPSGSYSSFYGVTSNSQGHFGSQILSSWSVLPDPAAMTDSFVGSAPMILLNYNI